MVLVVAIAVAGEGTDVSGDFGFHVTTFNGEAEAIVHCSSVGQWIQRPLAPRSSGLVSLGCFGSKVSTLFRCTAVHWFVEGHERSPTRPNLSARVIATGAL